MFLSCPVFSINPSHGGVSRTKRKSVSISFPFLTLGHWKFDPELNGDIKHFRHARCSDILLSEPCKLVASVCGRDAGLRGKSLTAEPRDKESSVEKRKWVNIKPLNKYITHIGTVWCLEQKLLSSMWDGFYGCESLLFTFPLRKSLHRHMKWKVSVAKVDFKCLRDSFGNSVSSPAFESLCNYVILN